MIFGENTQKMAGKTQNGIFAERRAQNGAEREAAAKTSAKTPADRQEFMVTN